MKDAFDLSVEVSQPYDFKKEALDQISQNPWVKHQWPLVYFIQNKRDRIAYVGESTNALFRLKNHLQNPDRTILDKVSIIGSDKFNKSATLDMEASLIQYISAEGTYQLQNGNFGLVNHRYYQQDLYKDLFKAVWSKLIEKKFVSRSLEEIQNTELFKFSPYKSLNEDQYASVLQILDSLTRKASGKIFISGSAGTGKTIVATYLMKLLCTPVRDLRMEELNEEELKEVQMIRTFQERYPGMKIGLVIAMSSLRKSIQHVFRKVPGLKASMVMAPIKVTKERDKFDLLIVDEAHRLRQFKNISFMGAFRSANQRLGFDDSGTELDWILAKSHHQIFFYDQAQSVKPSDIPAENFRRVLSQTDVIRLELKTQMRVKGGSSYIAFVDELLNVQRVAEQKFEMEQYDLRIFSSMKDLYERLAEKEKQFGLCRLIAGYAWPWISKKNPGKFDIQLDGERFRWNTTDQDWVNSQNAFREVGCIHTTQGYDLNYAGIIFGPEITLDERTGRIEIRPEHYHDINGKKSVSDINDLKAYIINIYKTLMYRGIRGTYIYACDPGLRRYFERHIPEYRSELPFRILRNEEARPYVNCIPLVNISVAAGDFSGPRFEDNVEIEWIEPPFQVSAGKDYFVCQVQGESMNKIIPNGAYCLFRKYDGGSRQGKIVLVASDHLLDSDYGRGYTVKEYHSSKSHEDGSWRHEEIVLKPCSTVASFVDIKLDPQQGVFKVIGVFERVISS